MLLFYIVGGAFALLFFMEITDTVVVYKDVPDFLWPVAYIVVPISIFFVIAFLSPEDVPENYYIFWETNQQKTVSIIGSLLICLSDW